MTDDAPRPAQPAERTRRPTVSDGRDAAGSREPMATRRRPDEERVERSRHARQILSGADIERPTRLSSSWAAPSSPVSDSQRTYLISLGVLLLIGLVLSVTVGFGVASIFFFLLALGLIGGWLAF